MPASTAFGVLATPSDAVSKWFHVRIGKIAELQVVACIEHMYVQNKQLGHRFVVLHIVR